MDLALPSKDQIEECKLRRMSLYAFLVADTAGLCSTIGLMAALHFTIDDGLELTLSPRSHRQSLSQSWFDAHCAAAKRQCKVVKREAKGAAQALVSHLPKHQGNSKSCYSASAETSPVEQCLADYQCMC